MLLTTIFILYISVETLQEAIHLHSVFSPILPSRWFSRGVDPQETEQIIIADAGTDGAASTLFFSKRKRSSCPISRPVARFPSIETQINNDIKYTP
jgi:hypothetical protein